jgi:hypothetical protein
VHGLELEEVEVAKGRRAAAAGSKVQGVQSTGAARSKVRRVHTARPAAGRPCPLLLVGPKSCLIDAARGSDRSGGGG